MTLARKTLTGNLLFTANGVTTVLACTEMSCEMTSAPVFYDHTLASSAPSNYNAAPMGNISPIQKKIHRYSPFAPKITASGIFCAGHHILMEQAIAVPGENDRPAVTAVFYRGHDSGAQRPIQCISGAVISSLDIEIPAGEAVTFSVEFVGINWRNTPPAGVPADGVVGLTCGKALTWDRCQVISSLGDVQRMSLHIKNNLQIVYTGSPPSAISPGTGLPVIGITPRAIRPGMQEVGGSISVFDFNAFDQRYGNNETIALTLKDPADDTDHKWKLGVAYAQPGNKADGGIFAQSVNFSGVSTDTDGVWRQP